MPATNSSPHSLGEHMADVALKRTARPGTSVRESLDARHVNREQRETEPCNVGQHVSRIGQKCQASGRPSGTRAGRMDRAVRGRIRPWICLRCSASRPCP